MPTHLLSKTLMISVVLIGLCHARPVRNWSYQQLVDESDLVVVAQPIESRDAGETTVPNMQLQAVLVETKFQVLTVFKGDKNLKEVVVEHLRLKIAGNVPNGPMLAAFDVKRQPKYLLFLKVDAKGRASPVSGQTDSQIGVKELGGYP